MARAPNGSVLIVDGKPQYLVPVVVDPERLDERRARVGLGAWLDYEKRMAEMQGRTPATAPRRELQPDTGGS